MHEETRKNLDALSVEDRESIERFLKTTSDINSIEAWAESNDFSFPHKPVSAKVLRAMAGLGETIAILESPNRLS
jgi:hypothetical protein